MILSWLRRLACRHRDSYFGQLVVERGRFVLVRCHRCGRVAVSETLVETKTSA